MNAKKEFLKHIMGRGKVVCAKIQYAGDYGYGPIETFYLPQYYEKKTYDDFCNLLDFNYDEESGGQELFGIILFEGSYSTRGEYDGSEWWQNHKIPTPKEVQNFSVRL